MGRLKIAKVATADISVRFLLLEQIKELQAMGHEVVAMCAPGPWVESIQAAGVTIETLPLERELRPSDDMRSLLQLRDCFRRHDFDVVHTHTPKAGILGPIAARMAGVPVVIHTIHGLLFHDRLPLWRRLLFWIPEKLTASCCDFLLSQSKEDLSVAFRSRLTTSKKLRYVGNGIEVGRFRPDALNGDRARVRKELSIPDDAVVIGSVGRLVYEKGFAELFQVAEQLTSRRRDLIFVVVGPEEPSQNDAIDPAQIRALQERGVLRFTGWQNNVERWYSVMDVFVLPSHCEGIPRACMEASASGRPVIATDIRGCREVVRDGETGLLVPVRDPAALGKAIERLADDPATRARMGAKGREHIQASFDAKLVFGRLREFYSTVVEPMVERVRADQ